MALKITRNTKLDPLYEYIGNWDIVIKQWLKNPQSISSNILKGSKQFQIDYMPEPYMGNYEKFSFVIINLNPGQGHCHSCILNKNKSNTLINQVDRTNYSQAVKLFPYLRDSNYTKLSDWDICPGRMWWKKKEKWIKHIINAFNPNCNMNDLIPNSEYPFAMELCAYHSKIWHRENDKDMKKGGFWGAEIENNVVNPILSAIDQSKYKTAFCIGKPIGDILESWGCHSIKIGITSPCTSSNIYQICINGKTRQYRILKDPNGHYIINTWAQGSNNCPSSKFYDTEKNILTSLRNNP